jgi:site-specific DNA-methyltransferase (adenine-specific)
MTFNTKGLMSSVKQNWRTPVDLYQSLDREFHFDHDPCPHETMRDFSIDGLASEWGSCSFVNPPYKDIKYWIKKGHNEWKKGKTVVFLIPARTDTIYFHEYIYPYAELRFIKGRVKFDGNKTGAPFPSMIAILKSHFFNSVSQETVDVKSCKEASVAPTDVKLSSTDLGSKSASYNELGSASVHYTFKKEILKDNDIYDKIQVEEDSIDDFCALMDWTREQFFLRMDEVHDDNRMVTSTVYNNVKVGDVATESDKSVRSFGGETKCNGEGNNPRRFAYAQYCQGCRKDTVWYRKPDKAGTYCSECNED